MSYDYNKLTKRIHTDWMPFFDNNKDELINILDKLNEMDNIIYPKKQDIFRAFYYHSPQDIKLTIIAQDPYINEYNGVPQAMGLCFSVPRSISENNKNIPPSLKNIRKEIKNCYPDYNIPNHGLLKKWARKQKILLLNSSLTVFKGKSNSHAYLWTEFTDKLIEWFSNINPHCVFLLMGSFAKNKQELIDTKKHKTFITVHPSPLSAHNGFFGCGVFKQINDYYESKNIDIIKW
jgi:uracil-DNA glycosylase